MLRVVDAKLPVDLAARHRAVHCLRVFEQVARSGAKLLPHEQSQRAPRLLVEDGDFLRRDTSPPSHVEGRHRRLAATRHRRKPRRDHRTYADRAIAVEVRTSLALLEGAPERLPAQTKVERFRVRACAHKAPRA